MSLALLAFLLLFPIAGGAVQAAATHIIRDFEWQYVPQASTIADQGYVIAEDQYRYFTIDIAQQHGRLRYHMSLTQGPRVDAYLLDVANFQAFQAQEAFSYFVAGSDEDTSGAIKDVDIRGWEPGTYYVVIDNTDMGTASPPANGVNDPATIRFFLELELSFSFRLTIPASSANAYEDVSVQERRGRWGYMVTTDDATMKELGRYLKEASTNASLGAFDTLSNVLAFTQSLPYTSDSVTTSFDDYARFPVETLVENGGDCEDTAILYATIVRILGYGAILISPPMHMATGVLGTDLHGASYLFKGGTYYYAETTGEGFAIGDLPQEYEGVDAQLYEITGEQFVPAAEAPNVPGAGNQPSGEDALQQAPQDGVASGFGLLLGGLLVVGILSAAIASLAYLGRSLGRAKGPPPANSGFIAIDVPGQGWEPVATFEPAPGLTPGERDALLEERLLRGDISEATYRELKAKGRKGT